MDSGAASAFSMASSMPYASALTAKSARRAQNADAMRSASRLRQVRRRHRSRRRQSRRCRARRPSSGRSSARRRARRARARLRPPSSIIAFIGSREVCAISPGSRNGILAKPMAGWTPSLRICISISGGLLPGLEGVVVRRGLVGHHRVDMAHRVADQVGVHVQGDRDRHARPDACAQIAQQIVLAVVETLRPASRHAAPGRRRPHRAPHRGCPP